MRNTLFWKAKLCYDQVTSAFGEWKCACNRQISQLVLTVVSRLAVAVKMSRTDQVNKKLTSSGELLLEHPREELRLMELLRGNQGKGHANILRVLSHTESGKFNWGMLAFCSKGEFFDMISNSGHMRDEDAVKYIGRLVSATCTIIEWCIWTCRSRTCCLMPRTTSK